MFAGGRLPDRRRRQVFPAWPRLASVASAVLVLLAAGNAAAATARAPAYGARDLSGIWTLNDYKGSSSPTKDRIPIDVDGQPPPMLPWVAKVYQDRIAAELAGKPLLNNKTQCLPAGMPHMMLAANYPIQILQTPGQVTMIFEEDSRYRLIMLDQKHPADLDLSYNGHSIGHWEGNVLHIDTVGLTDKKAIDQIGMPHTTALHVTERLRRMDANDLELFITIEDPGAFTRPWTIRRTYGRAPPGERIREYVCAENNRNPILAGGVQGFVGAVGNPPPPPAGEGRGGGTLR